MPRMPITMFLAKNAPDLGFNWAFIWAKNAPNLYRIMPVFKGRKRGMPQNRVSHFLELILEMYLRRIEKKLYFIWLDNPLE